MADRPLAGITVVELCQNVAGPYAGLVLAQLGARVIKVERPGTGDDTRTWGPPFWGTDSVMFTAMNAGKESVFVDLDRDDDRRRLHDIVARADVVLAAWRPGSLERRGFGPDHLTQLNPRLVYCSISGFGATGPMAGLPGYDPLIQAFSGLMSITGEPGGPPVRVGTSIIDMGTGMWAVVAVLVALHERRRSGRGQHLSTSLFETGLAWLPYQIVGYLATGSDPKPMGSGLEMLVPYQAFPAADRPLVVCAGNDALWSRLCTAMGRHDLGSDRALATNPQRVERRHYVVQELTRTFHERTAEEWESVLRDAGIPCAVVQQVSEVVTHPQTEATGMLVDVDHPEAAGLRLLGLPFALDGWRPTPSEPAPPLEAGPRRERTPSGERDDGRDDTNAGRVAWAPESSTTGRADSSRTSRRE